MLTFTLNTVSCDTILAGSGTINLFTAIQVSLQGGTEQATLSGSFTEERAITVPDETGTLATREWCQSSLLCLKRLPANEDRVSTTTLADVAALGVTLAAGNYYFRYWMDVGQTSSGGFKFDLTFSGTATVLAHLTMHDQEAGTGAVALIRRITAFSSAVAVGTGLTTAFRVMIEGVIKVTAGGQFVPRFAQNTAAGTGTIRENSLLTLTPIP